EEERDLPLRALERIGPVDDVPPDRQREVPADRPRFGLRGIRLAHHLPHDGDGPLALQDHRDDGPRGDVRHEGVEESLALVFRIIRLSEGPGHAEHLHRDDLESATLEAPEDFADERALDRVRLRAVLLLGPAEDRRPEGWALDEGREEFLDLSSREVRTEPFVDQVGEIRRDVLALRRLDRRLAGGGLGGRGHFLGDDRLFGGGSSRRAAERLRPRCPTRHAPEVEQVRLAFVGAEQEDGPILPDEHLAGPRFDLVAAEGTGTAGGHRLHRTESLRASRAVSRSINTSPTWMLPFTFRVMMRPLSRPSRTRTFTWTASPVIPVRPTTSTTSAGMLSSSAIVS